jgi:hypothetical protein
MVKTLRDAAWPRHRWYGAAIVKGRSVLLLGVLAAAAAGGCGAARQDKGEPQRSFAMRVVRASFPARQSIAKLADLELAIENAGSRTAPNVAVSLDSFYYTENFPHLAADKRPIWVVESGPGVVPKSFVETQSVTPPGGGQTAYVSTWALGPLAPGRVRVFKWRVAPVKAGTHTVHYTVAAGLAGKAKAQLANGNPVRGSLVANVAPAPGPVHVDPQTGRVVAGAAPASP